MDTPFGMGAIESPIDPRTVQYHDVVEAGTPLISGGKPYTTQDIDNQHTVGICTAISLTQNRQKANGRKYSPEFQYLLQKKFFDLNWDEGSSIFYALKAGKQYGFLPAELWTHTTESDRMLPYDQYIAKLQAIPALEIQRLIGLCVDNIAGYAAVDITDPQKIAQAINTSQSGILAMYRTGIEWYTPSWNSNDIDPIKPPATVTSGHAINISEFDYTFSAMYKLPNTWGTVWDLQGQCHINWSNYKMQEAWSILPFTPTIFTFTRDLYVGMNNSDVLQLQKRLGVDYSSAPGLFGPRTFAAVVEYQKNHDIPPTGYVGPLTRAALNAG